MAVVLKKNTVDVSSSIEVESLIATFVLTKEVSRLQFRIKNYSGKTTCILGDQIDLYEDGTRIFGGTITEKNDIVEGGILIATQYTANDWSFRMNSKLVVRNYTEQDPQAIVNDIVASFTDGTFGTTGVVLGGFNIPSIKFNYEQVTVSLEKIAKQIGWEWYVDPDKNVHFFPPSTVVTAPYVIDDTTGNLDWTTLDIEQSLINMKNSVYVIGGTYTKSFDATTTPDKYLTDGTQSIYATGYPYSATSTTGGVIGSTGIVVTLDGVTQYLGFDQVTSDSLVQVQYSPTGRFVRFTSVPATGKTVKIYGPAQIPILAHVQDQVAIAAYGEIQDAIIDQQIKSIEEAQARGNAQISQFGSPVYAVKFSTQKTGFRVGQTVEVDSSLFGTDVMVIVKRIIGKMNTPTQLRYEIECVGTEKVSFVDIMKLLLMRANADTIVTDSTVLQVLLLFTESIASADTLHAPTTTTGPYKWGADAAQGTWNFMTWG